MERLTTYKTECNREMICRFEDCDICEEYCPISQEDNCSCLQEILEKLGQYEDAEEQGLLLRLLCKVGSTVYVKATCESVCMSKDFETGVSECPFENDCPFEECEDGNERIFKTSVMSIWNNGSGWYFNVRGLCVDIAFIDIGTSVFFTREEAEQALEDMKGKV